MIYPVDLQLHSTASDGTDSPAEVVRLAAARHIRVIALTDHDSVLGLDDAIAAGRQHGVYVLPALEFSTRSQPDLDLLDINILAFGIRHRDTRLHDLLAQVIGSRIEQKVRQIEKLQGYGINISVDEVLARAQGVPGRVHIAQVAFERNPDRFTSVGDVFVQYLATDAQYSTVVGRTFSLTAAEAIEATHAAGGIAVLAHPGAYPRIQDIDGAVSRLAGQGLDGIEVRYPYAFNRGNYGANAAQVDALVARFTDLARAHDLRVTGGSDYHGTAKPGIEPGNAGLTWHEWEALAERSGW